MFWARYVSQWTYAAARSSAEAHSLTNRRLHWKTHRYIQFPPWRWSYLTFSLPEGPIPLPRQTFLHRSLTHPLTYSSLSYDVSTPPSTLCSQLDDLSEWAFGPFPTRIEVVCDGLPWTIEIISSQDTPLTCLDVLSAIHSALTRPVCELEWAVTSPEMRRIAWGAFLQRVQHSVSCSHQGVQRLDFLSRRTWFSGLSSLEDQSDRWIMHLDVTWPSYKYCQLYPTGPSTNPFPQPSYFPSMFLVKSHEWHVSEYQMLRLLRESPNKWSPGGRCYPPVVGSAVCSNVG